MPYNLASKRLCYHSKMYRVRLDVGLLSRAMDHQSQWQRCWSNLNMRVPFQRAPRYCTAWVAYYKHDQYFYCYKESKLLHSDIIVCVSSTTLWFLVELWTQLILVGKLWALYDSVWADLKEGDLVFTKPPLCSASNY